MVRSHLYKPLQNQTGDLISNVSVLLLEPGTNTEIGDTIYSDVEGSETLSNPFAASGAISIYLDESRYVDVKVTTDSLEEHLIENMLVIGPASQTVGGLEDLDDVDFSETALADGHTLIYDFGTGTWQNVAGGSVFALKSHGHNKQDITDLGTIGTAASRDVPTSGNATAEQVVRGSDSRLTNARTPSAHKHSGGDIESGRVLPQFLGTGTPTASKVLNGEGAWVLPAAGGGSATQPGIPWVFETDTVYEAPTGGHFRLTEDVDNNPLILFSPSDAEEVYRGQWISNDISDHTLVAIGESGNVTTWLLSFGFEDLDDNRGVFLATSEGDPIMNRTGIFTNGETVTFFAIPPAPKAEPLGFPYIFAGSIAEGLPTSGQLKVIDDYSGIMFHLEDKNGINHEEMWMTVAGSPRTGMFYLTLREPYQDLRYYGYSMDLVIEDDCVVLPIGTQGMDVLGSRPTGRPIWLVSTVSRG